MNDLDYARTVPCPACKMLADSSCIDPDTGAKVNGVHQTRIYRAYVVAEAGAHNRAVELAAEVDTLKSRIAELEPLARAAIHYMNCRDGEVGGAYAALAAAVIDYERRESP